MAADDERREAAERLRKLSGEYDSLPSWSVIATGELPAPIDDAMMAIGLGRAVHATEICDRLANLIEPPMQCPHYHSDNHYCSIYEDIQPIDREALLVLADDLEESADSIIDAARNARFRSRRPSMCEAKHDAYEWRCIARSIREACGAVE